MSPPYTPTATRAAATLLASLVLLAPPLRASEALAGFDCLITPHTEVEISTREEGILDEVLVRRGEVVSSGQVVARLDRNIEEATVELRRAAAEATAEIEELQEAAALASRENDRISQLVESRVLPATEMDRAAVAATRAGLQLRQAQDRQRIAELELERAQQILANRSVRSPLDGVVLERLMSPGESVENRPILRVARVDPLFVELIVPVEFYGRVEPGMAATLLPRYPGAAAANATVEVVDPVVDAASNTFGVRLVLPNPGMRVPAGVRCDITFD